MLFSNKDLLIIIGISEGIYLGFAPEMILRALILHDFASIIESIILVLILVVTGLILWEKRPCGMTRKQAYRMFAIGISVISFIFALITFLKYPVILGSNKYDWMIPSAWNIGGVSMGSLAFFNASILWNILTGSFFGLLENWLRLK